MCFTLSYKVNTVPCEGDGNIQNGVGPVCSGVGSLGSLSVLRYNRNINVLSVICKFLSLVCVDIAMKLLCLFACVRVCMCMCVSRRDGSHLIIDYIWMMLFSSFTELRVSLDLYPGH